MDSLSDTPIAINVTVNVQFTIVSNEINGNISGVSSDLQQQIVELVGNTINSVQSTQPPPLPLGRDWYETWWGVTLLTVSGGLIVAGVSAYVGWI